MFQRSAFRLRVLAGGILLAGAAAGLAGLLVGHRASPAAPDAASAVPIAVLPAGANGVPKPDAGYFTISAAPGRSVRLHALILNRAHGQTLLTLAPVDAYRTAGGLTYALPESRRRGVGTWMRPSAGMLSLAPGGRRLVSISLHVPAEVAAGTYAGALSIGLPQRGTAGHAEASIRVQVRLAVAVVVRVRAGRPG